MLTKYLAIPGNYYNKYNSKNFIERYLVRKFTETIDKCVKKSNIDRIVDVGCGEGHFSLRYASRGYSILAIDLEEEAINKIKFTASEKHLRLDIQQGDVYNLQGITGDNSLVLCLEVLEHLDRPFKALESLKMFTSDSIILSVPREPIWSVLNLLRFKYIRDLGNTPGHIQKWSKKEFVEIVSRYLQIIDVYSPLPWTIIHARKVIR